jgi:hypothetical protein
MKGNLYPALRKVIELCLYRNKCPLELQDLHRHDVSLICKLLDTHIVAPLEGELNRAIGQDGFSAVSFDFSQCDRTNFNARKIQGTHRKVAAVAHTPADEHSRSLDAPKSDTSGFFDQRDTTFVIIPLLSGHQTDP